MAASRMSRRLVGQILTNCVKTRSCHAVILQTTPKNVTVSAAKRLLSTSRCLCEEKKNNESNQSNKSTEESEVNKDSSVGTEQDKSAQSFKEQESSARSNNSQNQSAVLKAKQASEIRDSSETSSLSDSSSSSSDSDSDSSSSDSDNETTARIDPALEKAAEDVATVLSGDKATTKAELIAKLKKPLRANKKPQDLVPQKKDKQKKKTTEAKQTDEDRGERRRRIVEKLKKDAFQAQGFSASDRPGSEGDRQTRREAPSLIRGRPAKPMPQRRILSPEEEAARLEKRREIIERLTKVNMSDKLGLTDDQAWPEQGRRPGRFNYQDHKRRQEFDDRMEGRFPSDRPRRDRPFDREMDGRREGRFPSDGPRRDRPFERFADRRDDRQQRFEPFASTEMGKPPVSAFGGKPLNIFTERPESEVWKPARKSLYDQLQEEKAEEAYNYPPANSWEEQIQLTRQGRLWTFPIDNEAGWEEEHKTGFQEHIFLERQIRDFPQKGPMRHFMELVTIALSKNPHMSVAEKHGHIDWFRQYFRSKEQVLVGPLGDMGVIKDAAPEKSA